MSKFIFEKGTFTRIARELGINPRVPGRWFSSGRKVPADRVPAVSRILGIPRHELRPDLWEPPSSDAP